jgi:histidinol dehydrogenase
MRRLSTKQPDFEKEFTRLVDDRRESGENITSAVADIIERVRRNGDAALEEYTQRFDSHSLTADLDSWTISRARCEAAYETLDPALRDALDMAAARIVAFHEKQRPETRDERDEAGVRLGSIWRPVDAAGLYVPGGRAAYPSSLLMNALPARVAGVKRIAVATPTPQGFANETMLAAAHIAGVDEIWRIGGAQAVAALATGTRRIRPVDVIAGPGNAYVAEAKRQLYGQVGIDMVAGPSEILVIADGRNDPAWTAADLLSQAEHDPAAQSILVTDDPVFANMVADEIAVQISLLRTGATAQESWQAHGTIIEVENMDQVPDLANRLAAEHVLLAVEEPDRLLHAIEHAGSVFLGRLTPEAIGDYIAGPNHVLPTGRRARFSSGLSVLDFMKRTSFIELGRDQLDLLGPPAIALAEAEGLPAHARSVSIRLQGDDFS